MCTIVALLPIHRTWCNFLDCAQTASLMAVGQHGAEEYLRAVAASHMDRAGLRFGSSRSEPLAAMAGTSAAIQHVTDLQVRPLDFHCRCSKEVNHSPTTVFTRPQHRLPMFLCLVSESGSTSASSHIIMHRRLSRNLLCSRWPTSSQSSRTAGRI